MKKTGLLATVCGITAFTLASMASAAPLGGPATGLTAADLGVVELVHGCHREWRHDRYGPHRHGRECRRIEPEPQYERRPIYEPRCWYVGPVRVCE